ncbi:MAG: tetratricopeptide repeat protein [Tumebacillaceae bacterium]
MNNSSLGQRIRQARKELKMTQHDLADGIVTSSMICQIENGKAFPSYPVLSALADRLSKPIEYFVSDTDTSKRQRSSYTLAKALMASGSYEKAYTLLKSLQDMPVSDPEDFQLTFSECCQQLGKYEEAAAPLDDMLTTAKNNGDYKQMLSILYRLGEIAEHGNQYQLALYHWEKAYELQTRIEIEPALRSKLLTSMGNTQYKLGYVNEAVKLLQQAFEQRESFQSLEELGQMYMTLSLSCRETRDLANATAFSERAMTIFKGLQNIQLATDVKRSMGILLAKQGQFDEAATHFEACIDTYTRAYDSFNVGLTQMEMSIALHTNGRLDEAIALMQNALTMLSSDELEAARAHHKLAEMYHQKGDLQNAIHHLNYALPAYQKQGQSVALVNAMNLSVLLYDEWEKLRLKKYGTLIIA